VVAVIAATFATAAMRAVMGPSVSLLFFPAIIIPAAYGGFGPAALASVLAATSIAYFFIPPVFVLDVGIDDIVRLGVFLSVGGITGGLSARRRHAEQAQRKSLRELESNVLALKQVTGWPGSIGLDPGTSIRRMLTHAAGVVGATAAAVVWESEDEPWVYLAATVGNDAIVKEDVAQFTDWRRSPSHPEIVNRIGTDAPASAPFETDQVAGCVYFTGVSAGPEGDLLPILALVAHEVGNSLGQLQMSERVRQVAVHEARIRVSRDLHDGVLQALTGIRFELQNMAGEAAGADADRLRALERALAIEQRELRLFIDDLKPASREAAPSGPIATGLSEMCRRLSVEWKLPISVKVTPGDMTLPRTIESAVRLMIHEGVSNALKHGYPARVTIAVDSSGDELTIAIIDDGRGFSFRGKMSHDDLIAGNAGPVSLRERVIALDGRLSVESLPSGSRIECVIPIAGHTGTADAG